MTDNVQKRNNCTVAYTLKARIAESQQPSVTRQRPVNNRGTVFSTRSVPRWYKQDNLEVAVRELLRFSRCKVFLLEAGSWARGQFGNPEEGGRPPLKAATKQRLVKTVTDWEDMVCPIVICEACKTVIA
jgi:hypothetical protein